MGRGIVNVVLGLVGVIGGLSGKLVFRGTDSGGVLAAIGGIFVIIGLVRIASALKAKPSAEGGEQ